MINKKMKVFTDMQSFLNAINIYEDLSQLELIVPRWETLGLSVRAEIICGEPDAILAITEACFRHHLVESWLSIHPSDCQKFKKDELLYFDVLTKAEEHAAASKNGTY